MARLLDGWFLALAARLLFAAILAPYYLASALTKFGPAPFGPLRPSAGAFAQIVPPVAEQYGYSVAAIPLFPWHAIVIAGTLAEIVLPLAIVLGLMTRLAALGMIGFIAVQTYVDVAFHGAALGALFDGQPGELIDQCVLWCFPLLLLAMTGGGRLSLDEIARRRLA